MAIWLLYNQHHESTITASGPVKLQIMSLNLVTGVFYVFITLEFISQLAGGDNLCELLNTWNIRYIFLSNC
jgi:hypothetical protein